jgi:hypothetical protein
MKEIMNDRPIAYFSMEMALRPDMPTYSGGLGVLARDTIRSAADLKLPMSKVKPFTSALGQQVPIARKKKSDADFVQNVDMRSTAPQH